MPVTLVSCGWSFQPLSSETIWTSIAQPSKHIRSKSRDVSLLTWGALQKKCFLSAVLFIFPFDQSKFTFCRGSRPWGGPSPLCCLGFSDSLSFSHWCTSEAKRIGYRSDVRPIFLLHQMASWLLAPDLGPCIGKWAQTGSVPL